MAANNNSSPPWYPEHEPSLAPRTNDWMRLSTEYIWSLRGMVGGVNQTVENLNTNITKQVTAIAQAVANAANNANAKPFILYGAHATRLASFPASVYAGYLYIETDRFQACYYSNGTIWILVEGTASGAFEFRYAGLNSADNGLTWIETSRNNVAGTPPYVTYRWSGIQWNYQSGAFYRPQNGLATLAGTFFAANSNGGNDLGAVVWVTDFHHQLQWSAFSGTVNANNTANVSYNNGTQFDALGGWAGFPITFNGNPAFSVVSVAGNGLTLTANANVTPGNNNAAIPYSINAWGWGPCDDLRAGEGPILREVDPSPTLGWQLYDGSNNVTYMQSDGTTGVVTLPNLVAGYNNNANLSIFLAAGGSDSGINAPIRPALATEVATFAGNSQAFSAAGANAGNDLNALTGPNPYTPAGTVSLAFVDANNNAVSNSNAISNTGTPPNIVRRPWFRR